MSCIVRVYTCINVIGVRRDESYISYKSVMSAEGLKLLFPKARYFTHCTATTHRSPFFLTSPPPPS